MPAIRARRGRKPVKGLAVARRQDMCEAAIRMFAQHGFHNTTLETIARAARVSVGLIYRYFADKDELLRYAIFDIQATYAAAVPQATASARSPLEQFVAAVHAYAQVMDAHKSAALLAYRASGLLSRRHLKTIMRRELKTDELLANLVDECIAARVFRRVDAQMFTYQVIAFTHSWVLEAWRLPRDLTVSCFVDRGLALMLPAVLTSGALRSPVARAVLRRSMSSQIASAGEYERRRHF